MLHFFTTYWLVKSNRHKEVDGSGQVIVFIKEMKGPLIYFARAKEIMLLFASPKSYCSSLSSEEEAIVFTVFYYQVSQGTGENTCSLTCSQPVEPMGTAHKCQYTGHQHTMFEVNLQNTRCDHHRRKS